MVSVTPCNTKPGDITSPPYEHEPHDSASSLKGKAFIKWARSQNLVSEQHSLSFEDFILKYCTQDNDVQGLSQSDIHRFITSWEQHVDVCQQPVEPHNAYVRGPPKPACLDDRVWTANGINKLRVTRDGEMGMLSCCLKNIWRHIDCIGIPSVFHWQPIACFLTCSQVGPCI